MKTPNQAVPPPVQEMWNTFVSTMGGRDPLETIRAQDQREAGATKELAPEPLSAAISVTDLPSVPVSTSSSGETEPMTTDFDVTGVLGEGGMGRVLLARQKSLQRDVALKVLKREENRRDVVQTLLAEAVITGSIEHPSIVPVHALGRDKNGLPVLVMKRIDGVSWRSLFEQANHPVWAKMGVDTSDKLDAHLEILMAVCNAVHYAHSRGIVHRDIKLDNIMIGGFGEVYLVDWGIAMRVAEIKASVGNKSQYTTPVGTLAYMAPEMAKGDVAHIDARTDVYLLGATLHHLIVGSPRHRGDTMLDVLFSATDSEPYVYDSSVPLELAALCNQAMHVDPDKRFSSAFELRQALVLFRRHRGSMALSSTAMEKLHEIEKSVSVDERSIQQAMTECRFAFMQALKEYPQNRPAREGLDHVLELMITHEIMHRNAEGAGDLLAQLSHERPDLAQRIAALEAELADEKAKADRLQAMERDADLRIGARVQLVVLSVLPIGLLLSWSILSFNESSSEMTRQQLILFPSLLAVTIFIAFLLVRRRLTTSISRRVLGLFVLQPIAVVCHRLFAIYDGRSSASIMMTDLIISAALSLSFAMAAFRGLAWLCVIFLAGAYAILRMPEHATTLFVSSATVGTVVLLVLWLRIIRDGKDQDKP